MSSMTSVLGNFGTRPTFTDDATGKLYTLWFITGKTVKTAFEDWLTARARARVGRYQPTGDPEAPDYARKMAEYNRRLDKHDDDVVAGRYAYHGEVAEKARQTGDGSVAWAACIFGLNPTVQEEFDEMLDVVQRNEKAVAQLVRHVAIESAPRRKAKPEGNAPEPAKE